MHRTIFTTPVVNHTLRLLSGLFLRATGWQVEGGVPADVQRSVVIAAPHTSNWDLPYTLMVAFVLRADIHWLGKASIFRAPFGGLMRWLGGIPVNREERSSLVETAARLLRESPGPLHLVVAPEGTRGRARYWKSGFYYIAQQAGVPILLAYMDYSAKRSGIGQAFRTTGDLDQDMVEIKRFYAPFKGKRPDSFDAGA
ncbi:MAG: 1-acyl-sn-glycerol-3-phosphate acyltransferase [Rubrivivax sp.]|nr:1-acyl-sn-glycerol-3-phosphate acyltransferase [Rubrivivax sp.]